MFWLLYRNVQFDRYEIECEFKPWTSSFSITKVFDVAIKTDETVNKCSLTENQQINMCNKILINFYIILKALIKKKYFKNWQLEFSKISLKIRSIIWTIHLICSAIILVYKMSPTEAMNKTNFWEILVSFNMKNYKIFKPIFNTTVTYTYGGLWGKQKWIFKSV